MRIYFVRWNTLNIRTATQNDIEALKQYDAHISLTELQNVVGLKRVYVVEDKGVFIGWLRYNLFWDNTPFMNMLFVLDGYRGRGIGRLLTEHWERDMKRLGYEAIMLSTPSDEYSQHFYIKLGYKTIGGFMCDGEPYEVILSKNLK